MILSQIGGVNWLMLDAQARLTTDLKRSSRDICPTAKEPLSDDAWHRVGVVWDEIDRVLYVDDIEVDRKPSAGLDPSEGRMIIGAGLDLEEGSFFSGFVDDVRIYNRVIEP